MAGGASPFPARHPEFRRAEREARRPHRLGGRGRARPRARGRLLRASGESPLSGRQFHPQAPTSSTISRSRTFSTTCSATSRCSPSPRSPTSCRSSASSASQGRGGRPAASRGAALLVHGRVRPRAARPASRRSTAPASSPASANCITRSKARSRTGSHSTCGACFAPSTGPTPSSRLLRHRSLRRCPPPAPRERFRGIVCGAGRASRHRAVLREQ